jgi:ubiquinone/menaquinone biosynthesis C-methylase UbiE
MTDTIPDPTTPDALAERLFGAAVAALELLTVHLGDRLGLYTALRDGGASTSKDLAERAGIHERYAREWLEQQAAAGIVECADPLASPGDRRYTLPEGHAVTLCDAEHPAYAAAFGNFIPTVARPLDQLAEAFRTGAGVPYADYELHDAQAAFTRPMFANEVRDWVAAIPALAARLAAGEPVRVADVGCGEGWFAVHLAKAFPSVEVDGFDLDDASIAAARRFASEQGVGDRVRFELQDVAAPAFGRSYDLVTAFEMLHDVADPVGVLRAMDRIARPDGVVLVVDEKVDDDFAAPADEFTRLLYGFSVLHCLPAGMDVEHGHESAGTGTVMRPSTVRSYAAAAGFGEVAVLDVDNDFFRFYRMR